jgi:transcriptional regulator with XRE-family HTH domain
MNTKQNETTVNKKWFVERLASVQMSQRSLAKMLGLEPSAITLTFDGRRRITSLEVHRLAELFNVSVAEVMRNAGFDVNDDIVKLNVVGSIGEKSVIKYFDKADIEQTIAPSDVPRNSFCLQVRQPGHANDGWMIFISAERVLGTNLLDRPALVELEDGTQMTALVRRGYKDGTVNLYPLHGNNEPLENQSVKWASPILWIRPN